MQFNPQRGFTTEVVQTSRRYVGHSELVRQSIRAVNTPVGLLAMYGKRGVGKSSLLRQVQQMALGDYELAHRADLEAEIPADPRTYLTAYYCCDSMIEDVPALLRRLCHDQDEKDGLLRLVPGEGKAYSQFRRSNALDAAVDLKLEDWGRGGAESSGPVREVDGDIVQTFRNYVNAIVNHQIGERMNRDGVLILIDDIDRVQDKSGLGSLLKSLSSESVKFGICGVGQDLSYLLDNPESVHRLLGQHPMHVKPTAAQARQILYRARELYDPPINFHPDAVDKIVDISEGRPYLVQLLGQACIEGLNRFDQTTVDPEVFSTVLDAIKSGDAFPALESAYQLAVGDSEDRRTFLYLLATQKPTDRTFRESMRRVTLDAAREDAERAGVEHVDQLILRLVDTRYGPVLHRVEGEPGTYEFANPVFRTYVKLRNLE